MWVKKLENKCHVIFEWHLHVGEDKFIWVRSREQSVTQEGDLEFHESIVICVFRSPPILLHCIGGVT